MTVLQHCCTHPGTGLCMCDCHDQDCACDNPQPGVSYVMRRFRDQP